MTIPQPPRPPEGGGAGPPPLRRYVVRVSYDTGFVNEIVIEAASPEAACALAIERAGADASGWDPIDRASPSYVEALAGGDDARDGNRAVPVPARFTAFGTLYPSALALTRAVGRLLRRAAEGRTIPAPGTPGILDDAEAAALWVELAERYVAMIGVAAEEGPVPTIGHTNATPPSPATGGVTP